MPLSHKGEVIKKALQSEYGKSRGEKILYAGKNAGTFTGIDSRADALTKCADALNKVTNRFDALMSRKIPKGRDTDYKHSRESAARHIRQIRSSRTGDPEADKALIQETYLQERYDLGLITKRELEEGIKKAWERWENSQEVWDPKTSQWIPKNKR